MGLCHSSPPQTHPAVLQSNPLFAGLHRRGTDANDETLEQIRGLFRVQSVKAGDVIVREGDTISCFYIVIHGSVVVTAHSTETGAEMPVQQLRPHDFFGESALFRSKASEVTATALSDCVLMKMDRLTFQSLIKLVPSLERDVREKVEARTAERLRAIPFFSSVRENRPWSKLDLLGSMLQFEEFESGAVVCREGEMGSKFYLIVHGAVSISISSATSEQPIVLDQLGPDQHFGEIALMRHTPRTATITCTQPSLLLSLTSSSFHSFLSIAPELAAPFSLLIDARTANVLKTIPMFRAVKENRPWNKVELIANMLRYEKRAPGERLWDRGDEVTALYILTGGVCREEEGDGGEVREIVSVSVLGGKDLVDDRRVRGSRMEAVGEVTLLSLDREKWAKWIALAPEVRQWLLDMEGRHERIEMIGRGSATKAKAPEEEKEGLVLSGDGGRLLRSSVSEGDVDVDVIDADLTRKEEVVLAIPA